MTQTLQPDTDPQVEPEPAPLRLRPFFQALVDHKGSDLHLKAGSAPKVRLSGVLTPLDHAPLTAEQAEAWVVETMDRDVRRRFAETNEADYSISLPGLGRFRANAFRARGTAALICRRVADNPLTLDQLGVPPVLADLALHHRGMVLVTGPTGSGKTTTLGGMVDLINATRPVHVLTIEDPIEIMHTDKVASVNQRELRLDTADFSVALRAAMRQDPDVILIGEMRDVETVRAAASAAETGHFVMSTLHTSDAAETVNRIIDFFPASEQKQIRLALAASLRGIVCQRLVPRADGAGRVCAMEVLVNTPRVAEAIADPDKTHSITDIVAEGRHHGMQTFDQHLVDLVMSGQVTVAAAKAASTNAHDLGVQLKRAGLDPRVVDAA
ncbi:type IV pilus twitching motility protein PilT [Nocardioides litoris]|uniref:type IV pilus twitching motility protein PilT n=1 Tax=Nocardioides litoris TaxID=1926648 RepID=UPI00111D54E7|nr:PilT/PilU family type 4a pilus ATPase [Nocardioides litoris]